MKVPMHRLAALQVYNLSDIARDEGVIELCRPTHKPVGGYAMA